MDLESKSVRNGVQIASYLILGRMLLVFNVNLQITSLRSYYGEYCERVISRRLC